MDHVKLAHAVLRGHLPPAAALAVEGVALAAAGLVVLTVLNVIRQVLTIRDPTKPPRVFHFVPYIGCAFSYGFDPLGFFERNRDKYGPVFTFPLFGREITVALGALGSNFVLNSPHQIVNAEQAYTNFTTPVFGKEVVYDCPNSVFMQQKKFIKTGLTTENFKRYVPIIADEVRAYLSKKVFLGDNLRKRRLMDPVKAASEITVCTAAATLQGHEVREALDETFAKLIHDLDGGFTPLNFVFPYLPIPSYRRRDRAQAKMREFYLSILRKRGESKEEHYKNGEPLTDVQIAHMMIALLMGGQHTSAATGAWAILRLADNPDFQEKLYQEQVDRYGDGHGGFAPLAYETLQTPLLTAFVKELLRVHPPLHSLFRKVLHDIPIPASVASPATEPHQPKSFHRHNDGGEYVVRAGGYVLATPGFTAVDERVWGRDGKVFRPERWLNGKAAKVAGGEDEGLEDYGWGKISKGGKSPYLPFGAGRHRCIGEAFAMLQISTIVATLVRETRWVLDSPGKFPKNDYTTMIVMPAKPRDVTFTRR
ncbi:hypothetical protein Rhopal_002252-T1 [Rhodotorula paludigena]|uniref:Lanosterol 14-alpha-demethylase n=1 Tax=Rhodotorula paludigena TaxID=86838 RepID=A0AAV5GKT3_9BASI|nr:hypothetical protein Rhopal_002252-T1 [Rhodotorula paludigena]